MAYGSGVIFDTISQQEAAPAAPLKMKRGRRAPNQAISEQALREAYAAEMAKYERSYNPGVGHGGVSGHGVKAPPPFEMWKAQKLGMGMSGGGGAGSPGGAPGVAGGTGGLTLEGLYGDYQKAFDEAKAANQLRYADILKGYGARYDRNMKYLEGAGIQEGADIRDQYREAGNTTRNRLASQGLAGTTIAPTLQMGVERQQRAELGRLNERLQNQRLSTDASLSGDALAFQERRDDVGPDYGMLASLAQGIGAAGNNMGGGGTMVTSSGGGGGSYRVGELPDRGTHMANRGMAAAPQTQPYPGMPATAGGAGMVAQRPGIRPRMSYYGA